MTLLISTEEYAKRANLDEAEVRRMFRAGILPGAQESPRSKIYIKVDDSPPPAPHPELLAMLRGLCKQFNTQVDEIGGIYDY